MAEANENMSALFLEFSRRKLLEHYWARLRACVEPLSEEQVWWRPNQASNSIGNLILHLNGNVRQWLVDSFNGTADERDRPAEFAATSGLTAKELMKPYTIQGYHTRGLEAVYQVVEHFGLHYGQITYIAKSVTGEDLGFYRDLSKTGRLDKGGGSKP